MKRFLFLIIFSSLIFLSWRRPGLHDLPAAGDGDSSLTINQIMQGSAWIGISPTSPSWSPDSKNLFFRWKTHRDSSEAQFFISPADFQLPQPAPAILLHQMQEAKREQDFAWNKNRTTYVYVVRGDLFMGIKGKEKIKRITFSGAYESNPQFGFKEEKIVYTIGQDLFAWDIGEGTTEQLTNFYNSSPTYTIDDASQPTANTLPPVAHTPGNEKWLRAGALENSAVLRNRYGVKNSSKPVNQPRNTVPAKKEKSLRTINIGNKRLSLTTISGSGRFILYRLTQQAEKKQNPGIVPNYLTPTGYTSSIPARAKVGTEPMDKQELYIYDRVKDTVWQLTPEMIPGTRDLPLYLQDYPEALAKYRQNPPLRPVDFESISWAPNAEQAVIEVHAQDYKDRWLLLLDPAKQEVSVLDRQHDEAWINFARTENHVEGTGWIDDHRFWYRSEASGYMHLYSVDIRTKEKKALTYGEYEVQKVQLSKDRRYFYITSNEAHPGERHFYRLPVSGGKAVQITSLPGYNEVTLSPDEKWLAIRYSYTNKPWELYIQENKPGAKPQQITFLAQSEEFKQYPWRDPELITFTASDGITVHARLYKPARPHPAKPAVIFLHGAGYVQSAHRWWSKYDEVYMFNNFLADNGYTVLDIDYRGSAGYGRDYRAAVYRDMGNRDVLDCVDAVKYLAANHGVNKENIGIYGGSHGGYLTLMAMFRTPGVFKTGVAMAAVTDWMHYHHNYTARILNEPATDSIAYHRSSAINYADGLKGNLLICHGMQDMNVHFQDAVRLTQKLIELEKENWDLAIYPLDNHGFTETASWKDGFKRIFRLFETTLKGEEPQQAFKY